MLVLGAGARRVTAVTPDSVEFRFVASRQVHVKIDRLRGLRAHTKLNQSISDWFLSVHQVRAKIAGNIMRLRLIT